MKFPYYNENDLKLYDILPKLSLYQGEDPFAVSPLPGAETHPVWMPDGEFSFLHEAAVIAYHGKLFASWYNNPAHELNGRTPIRARKSLDGGKTWDQVVVIADDPTGEILYCPPVYGIVDDTLYLILNQMVAPDHIHALDLYRYNEEADRFEFLWSRPIPFKLNTNVVHLQNGKLMLPGRIAELDSFPNTPAVLISDDGSMEGEWRLVYIAPNGDLPDGSKLVHPEISCAVEGENILMFCRDDQRNVPLAYTSGDFGETWAGPFAIDIPFTSSKIYAGELSDGRHYVMGNIWPADRSRLAIYLTDDASFTFTHGWEMQNGILPALGVGQKWHYPVADESDGYLRAIYTLSVKDPTRGAVLQNLPVAEL